MVVVVEEEEPTSRLRGIAETSVAQVAEQFSLVAAIAMFKRARHKHSFASY